MNKVFFLGVLLLFNVTSAMSQISLSRQGQGRDSLQAKPEIKVANIQDYLIIGVDRDTTFVDTTLSIKKDYKFNYLRRDDFGLLPFANLGQTYNSLTHNFKTNRSLPVFGARAKHFNYMEIEDINYYHVPTPLTELFYKTAFEQGQLLDAFFTVNVSKEFNFSIAYKGLRSGILNINVPDVPWAEIKGFKATRLGNRHKSEGVIIQHDPRGEPMYWVGPPGAAQDAGEGTDFHAVINNYVSITPLQIDLTRYDSLAELEGWLKTRNKNTD